MTELKYCHLTTSLGHHLISSVILFILCQLINDSLMHCCSDRSKLASNVSCIVLCCVVLCDWQLCCVLSHRFNTVDMCVAVAIEAGLITPIVFGADRKVGVYILYSSCVFTVHCTKNQLFWAIRLFLMSTSGKPASLIRGDHSSWKVTESHGI